MTTRKTRYFVVYELKNCRIKGDGCMWEAYRMRHQAERAFENLRGQTIYRCLSFGLGNILRDVGRERLS